MRFSTTGTTPPPLSLPNITSAASSSPAPALSPTSASGTPEAPESPRIGNSEKQRVNSTSAWLARNQYSLDDVRPRASISLASNSSRESLSDCGSEVHLLEKTHTKEDEDAASVHSSRASSSDDYKIDLNDTTTPYQKAVHHAAARFEEKIKLPSALATLCAHVAVRSKFGITKNAATKNLLTPRIFTEKQEQQRTEKIKTQSQADFHQELAKRKAKLAELREKNDIFNQIDAALDESDESDAATKRSSLLHMSDADIAVVKEYARKSIELENFRHSHSQSMDLKPAAVTGTNITATNQEGSNPEDAGPSIKNTPTKTISIARRVRQAQHEGKGSVDLARGRFAKAKEQLSAVPEDGDS